MTDETTFHVPIHDIDGSKESVVPVDADSPIEAMREAARMVDYDNCCVERQWAEEHDIINR